MGNAAGKAINVRLEIPDWMASLLEPRRSGALVLHRKLDLGAANIGRLLDDLAREYPNFRNVIFDPEAGTPGDQVVVVLNDALVLADDLRDVGLADGDRIMLLPQFAGG